MMADETREKWQAVITAFAKAFGEAVAAVWRMVELAMQGLRKFATALSVSAIMVAHPQADRTRLVRHLSACADPWQRAQYMLSQARLGQSMPMLA